MPASIKGNELSFFTDSTIQWLTSYAQSSLAHDKNSIETLKLVIEGKLLPKNFQTISPKKLKQFALYVQAKFADWPKIASDEHVTWFREEIFMHFTDKIIRSPAFKECTSASETDEQSLRLSIMKRMKRLCQTLRPQVISKEDIELCLQWCKSLDSRTIAKEMSSQLSESIQKRVHTLKTNVIQETQQEKPLMAKLFEELDDLIRKTRSNYLFDKIDGAELHLTQALQQMKQDLLSLKTTENSKSIRYFCNYLELTEEQRHIRQIFLALFHHVRQLEPQAKLHAVLAIMSGEFQITAGDGFIELNKHSSAFKQRLSDWKPNTNAAGIRHFKALFIDYYFKPISQLLNYYGIDLKHLTVAEHLKIQTTIVNTIVEHEGLNANVFPQEKRDCLESWLNWYPEQLIATNQNGLTQKLIHKELKKFAKNVKRNNNFDGFDHLEATLFNNPIFNFDAQARSDFYHRVKQMIAVEQFAGLSSHLEKNHPEYLLDLGQYLLYGAFAQLLDLIPKQSQEGDLSKEALTKIFLDFPAEEEESSMIINALFAHDLLIESFDARFEAWQPEVKQDEIPSFIEEWIDYYAQPLRTNKAWQEFFSADHKEDNDSMRRIFGTIILKIQSEWTKRYPEKQKDNSDKLICLHAGIEYYLQNSATDFHDALLKMLINNKLDYFLEKLKSKGKETSPSSKKQVLFDINSQFRESINSIRASSFFKSDTPKAEALLHDEIHQFWQNLSVDISIKQMDKAKVKAAILADKRLSIKGESTSPKSSLKSSIHTHFSRTKAGVQEARKSPTDETISPDGYVRFNLNRSPKEAHLPIKDISPETTRKLPTRGTLFLKQPPHPIKANTDEFTKACIPDL